MYVETITAVAFREISKWEKESKWKIAACWKKGTNGDDNNIAYVTDNRYRILNNNNNYN